MVTDEALLEELYELLTLYFEVSANTGPIKPSEATGFIEPQLDRIIFKETLFAKISNTIMRLTVGERR